MNSKSKDQIDSEGEVKESRLLRITEAEKKIYNSPLAIAVIILMIVPVLIPDFANIHHEAEGKGNRFNGAEAFGISTPIGVVIFAAWVIICFFAMKHFISAFDKKLDEVERFIEYKASAYAGVNTFYLLLAVWSFGMWFPKYHTITMNGIPWVLLCGYAVFYLILRAKYRKQYEA